MSFVTISYGDYVEQLTYLLFLEMADEQTKPPFSPRPSAPTDKRLQDSGDSLR